MTKQKKKKPIAVFDIDGTIFRSSLLIELVESLIAEQVLPSSRRRFYQKAYRAWLNRTGTYDKYIKGVINAHEGGLKGVSEKQVLRVASRVLKSRQFRIYRYTRDLAQKLKKTHFLVAISGSPHHIVQLFAKKFGFHKVYGRVFEVDASGRFTGTMLYQDLISDKAKILKRVLDQECVTLSGSIGVGDTETDISFLKMVSRPIAFNPNQKLYRVARRRGWKIVVERKDVVYQF